jgi:hypothetical protein
LALFTVTWEENGQAGKLPHKLLADRISLMMEQDEIWAQSQKD